MKKCFIILCIILICLSVSGLSDGYSEYENGDYMARAYIGDIAVVCTKSVTIRSEPSYNGKKVQSASNGNILLVHSMYNNWVQVTYNKNGTDYDGWVIRDYIVIQPMTITLCSSNIPAYCAPDRSSKIVGSLPKETELTVLGTWGDFYIVNLREASAFISMDADVFTSGQFYASIIGSTRRVVTARTTTLRSGPGPDFKELARVPANTVLVSGDSFDGWIVVNYDGITGFISESDIQLRYSDEGNG